MMDKSEDEVATALYDASWDESRAVELLGELVKRIK